MELLTTPSTQSFDLTISISEKMTVKELKFLVTILDIKITKKNAIKADYLAALKGYTKPSDGKSDSKPTPVV